MEPAARLSRGDPEETSSTVVISSSDLPRHWRKDAGAGVTKRPAGLNSIKSRSAASVHKEVNSRLEARVFELENRLRETEEELQFYFEFFKKAKKEESRGSSGRQQEEQQQASKNSDDLSDDSDLDDEVPSSNHYTGDKKRVTYPPPPS